MNQENIRFLRENYLLETDVSPTLPTDFIWIKENEIEHYALPRLIDLLVKSL